MAMGAIANGGKLLEPVLVQERAATGAARRVREAGVARAPRGRAPGRRAHGRRDADGGDRGGRDGGRGGRSRASASPARRRRRRRSTRRRASTRRRSTRPSSSGSCPAEQPRLVVAVVLDEPTIGHYGGDLAGPGLPPRRRGEPALPRRHALGQRRRRSPRVKREGDPADATLAMMKPRRARRSADAARERGAGRAAAGQRARPRRHAAWRRTTS